MPEILLCNKPTRISELASQCGIDNSSITGLDCNEDVSILQPHHPYLIGAESSTIERTMLSHLGTGQQIQNLTNTTLSFGEDNTLALAEIMAKLKEQQISLIGTSTSVYASRIQGFGQAVKKYQEALFEYRDAIGSHAARRIQAKQKAFSAFKDMQIRFRHELAAVTAAANAKAKRGTPLSNPIRATNIARSSRHVAKLNITSQAQASQLVKYSKHAKFLGNGLAVIDFGTRVGNIHNSYKAGDNWERELFIESSSFVASALAASAAVKVGSAALSFLVVATPIGWVGLIVGGLVVAGVAAGAGIWVNNKVTDNSGALYDDIMKNVSALW